MRIILGLLSLLMLMACGAPASHEKTIFRYNEASGITSLDPLKANNLSNIWAVQQLYNGLLQLDEEGHLQPCIAKEWQLNDSATEIVFYLRTDILFHENACFHSIEERKLKAQDVVFSLQRVAQEPAAAWMLSNVAEQENQKAIRALNDSVVIIQLKHPSAVFLRMLTMPYGMIISEKAVPLLLASAIFLEK